MIGRLKKLKIKTLLTINQFIDGVDDLKSIKEYNAYFKREPLITDFINYDMDGFQVDVKPIFKGWTLDQETSSENKKVARLGENRLYFHTDNGVFIINKLNATDNLTYNSLAIFFEGNLKLS